MFLWCKRLWRKFAERYPFLSFILKRVLFAFPMFFAVVVATFVMVRVAPGNPFFNEDNELPAEVLKSLQEQYGFDKPIWEQFQLFLMNAVQGNFGESFRFRGMDVSEIIGQALPVSATLGILAMCLALMVGITLGILSAIYQNSWIDYLNMSVAVAGKTIPPMVIAPLFIAIFSMGFQLLPIAGWGTGAHMIGPVICLSVYNVVAIARLVRGAMLEVLRKKHMLTLKAKGMPKKIILLKHGLREASLPLLSYLPPATSGLLVGTVVVEKIFNIPGLGRYIVDSAIERDYPLVLGITMVATFLLVVLTIVSDLVLGLMDPRIRLQGKGAAV